MKSCAETVEGECDPEGARLILLGSEVGLRSNALVLRSIIGEFDHGFKRKRLRATHNAMMVMPVHPHMFSIRPLSAVMTDSGRLIFPTPTGLVVNMMPFLLFDPLGTLPESCKQYAPIVTCCPLLPTSVHERKTRVAYLTVHESEVAPGMPQRRPGLHIERHQAPCDRVGRICRAEDQPNNEYRDICWALGCDYPQGGWPVDGIFMASSAEGSCRVWPVLVDEPDKVTDRHGGLDERLRPDLGEGTLLGAGQLCWLTDRTPHESLPLPPPATYKQFFRLVVGPLGEWYSKHNTANPTGVAPDTIVTDVDKFD
jgi:hypothetical protein